MNLRVGRIPFLVCAPFFHLFFRDEARFEGYSFDDGAPSALNQKLWTGNVHLAPASSIAYARAPQDLVLAPDLCTSCKLEVNSVELFSRYPLGELSGKRIYMTSQSGTSVALLRVICSQYANVRPEYVTDRANCDAALLIGDEALVEKSKKHWPFCYDMALLWRSWHGLPFVFGAWSIHKSALSTEVRPKLESFLGQVHESIAEFRKEPALALKTWAEHYPVPFSAEQLKGYYDSLDYEFTDERKESLELYFNLCAKEGILSESPTLQFL
jgi:chorismate dehydratase